MLFPDLKITSLSSMHSSPTEIIQTIASLTCHSYPPWFFINDTHRLYPPGHWHHERQAAAAAKSLQSCPTLCDPIDSSLPGSAVPGILQARTRPWDSPGKNIGVGCHFLLQCMRVKSESEVAQSCPSLRDLMDCSLPGSSVHGIFQARVLEWGAIAFSVRDRSQLQNAWGTKSHRQAVHLLNNTLKERKDLISIWCSEEGCQISK